MSTTLECVIDIAVNPVNQLLRTTGGERKKEKKSLQSKWPFAEKLLRSVSQATVALQAELPSPKNNLR